MVDMPEESILIRIKKLLALSQKNSNENEAANAAAKAQELLIRYNLSEESLGEVSTIREEKFVREFYTKHRKRSTEQRWKVLLAFSVAKGNLCKVLHYHDKSLGWFGKPSNIEIAQFMFETLCYDLEFIAEKRWKQILELRNLQNQYPQFSVFTDPTLTYVHGKSWKASFYRGAVEVITQRLNAGLTDLRAEPSINALITTNDSALKMFVNSLVGKTRTYNSGTISVFSGYDAGRKAGAEIQFKRGVNGAGGSYGPKLIKG